MTVGREKLGMARRHPPTPLSKFLFFGNMYNNKKKHKKHKIPGSMLVHRLRRWPNIDPAIAHSMLFAKIALHSL